MTDVPVDTRAELIEGYAGKAADLTRQIISRGFATADGVKALFTSPKAQATAAFAKARTTATTWWIATKTRVKAAKPSAPTT